MVRDEIGGNGGTMTTLMQDVRYALRMLRKSPGFTAIAILTLALGIGANAAVFSVVDGLFLRPLPVKDPGQLVTLSYLLKDGSVQDTFSVAAYRDLRAQTTGVFSSIVAFNLNLDGFSYNGKPERVLSNYVTGNYFADLGLQPAAGRLFLPREGETIGADAVVVLGYAYWQSHFGGDASAVGKSMLVDGHPLTIVGVAPKGFEGTRAILKAQAFLPLGMESLSGAPPDLMENRTLQGFNLLARLKPGVTLAQADAELAVVGRRMAEANPATDKETNISAYPERLSRPNRDRNNTLLIGSSVFLGLAVMVMLLACLNVANILLVRASAREREMAIRTALGAGRARLIRQMLTESVILALGGGIAGIALGGWAVAALGSMDLHTDLPINITFGMDWRVFAYAFGAALLNGLIVGVVPAVRAARGNINRILHGGGRGIVGGRARMRDTLVAAQVAGSLAILIIAGLFTRSLMQAQRADLGFDPSHVADFTMDPNEIGYNKQQTLQFYRGVLERVRALPGVQSAAIATVIPLGYYGSSDTLDIPGYQTRPDQPAPSSAYNVVSADYFDTLSIPIRSGRAINEADGETSAYVAVINEQMAKTFWPGQEPLGRQFRLSAEPSHTITVVGVAGNTRLRELTGPFSPYFYVPYAQHADLNSFATLQVRMAGPPSAMIPAIEQAVHRLAPDLPVFDAQPMRRSLDSLNGYLLFRLGAIVAGAMGLLGLALAVIGVYGVVSYAANLRTHEIGVRMALGAQPVDVLRMIFGQGMVIVGLGVALGIAGAMAAGRVVGSFLVVSARDPVTYVAVSAILIAVALAACFIPARRAMRVDPMVALRYE
jgi:predicted permease